MSSLSFTQCIENVNSYAEWLSANPLEQGSDDTFNKDGRPRPLVYNGENCSGTMIPALGEFDSSQGKVMILNSGFQPLNALTTVQSVYVPGGWQVIVELKAPSVFAPGAFFTPTWTIPNGNPRHFPSLFPTPHQIRNDSGYNLGTVLDSFGTSSDAQIQVTIKAPLTASGKMYTADDYRHARCMGRLVDIVGSRYLTSFEQGSDECDAFMDGFCASSPDHPDCVCKADEEEIKNTFCGPNSDDPACASADDFASFIPVTCLGRRCAGGGYRWKRMMGQRCNVTLCQQILDLHGNDIVVNGGQTLWCGNKPLATPDVVSSVVANPRQVDSQSVNVPEWAWILVGFGMLVAFVAVPLAIVVWRRQDVSKIAANRPKAQPKSTTIQPSSLFESPFV